MSFNFLLQMQLFPPVSLPFHNSLCLISLMNTHHCFYQIPIPMTEGLDPVSMLTDDAMVAQWNNEGLPGDKMSTQNATILTNCEWSFSLSVTGFL